MRQSIGREAWALGFRADAGKQLNIAPTGPAGPRTEVRIDASLSCERWLDWAAGTAVAAAASLRSNNPLAGPGPGSGEALHSVCRGSVLCRLSVGPSQSPAPEAQAEEVKARKAKAIGQST